MSSSPKRTRLGAVVAATLLTAGFTAVFAGAAQAAEAPSIVRVPADILPSANDEPVGGASETPTVEPSTPVTVPSSPAGGESTPPAGGGTTTTPSGNCSVVNDTQVCQPVVSKSPEGATTTTKSSGSHTGTGGSGSGTTGSGGSGTGATGGGSGQLAATGSNDGLLIGGGIGLLLVGGGVTVMSRRMVTGRRSS